MRVKSPQITCSAVGNSRVLASSGRSSNTTGRKPMVVSRGHRAWEICPAPNSRARWPMGRGREIYPAAMEKPGVRRAWAVSSGRLPETTLSRSSSAGAEPSSASTSQPAVWRFSRARARLAVSLHRGSSAGIN